VLLVTRFGRWERGGGVARRGRRQTVTMMMRLIFRHQLLLLAMLLLQPVEASRRRRWRRQVARTSRASGPLFEFSGDAGASVQTQRFAVAPVTLCGYGNLGCEPDAKVSQVRKLGVCVIPNLDIEGLESPSQDLEGHTNPVKKSGAGLE